MKTNQKDTTLKTLIKLKAEVYARSAKRAKELSQAGGDLMALATKLQAVHKRADFEASRIAFVINLVRIRA